MVASTNSYLGLMRLDRHWWAVMWATQGYRSVRVRG